MGGHVELSVSLVEAEGGSVESDDVAESVNDWEVLELLGVDDNSGELLAVQGGVDNLERAERAVCAVGSGSEAHAVLYQTEDSSIKLASGSHHVCYQLRSWTFGLRLAGGP